MGAVPEPPVVLIIEDDDDVAALLSNRVTRLGARVHRAATGQEGMDLAQRTRPQVVLVDLLLPGMRGEEVIRALRSSPATAGARIGVTSVLDREEYPDEADGILPKPFTQKDVDRVVRRLMGLEARGRA